MDHKLSRRMERLEKKIYRLGDIDSKIRFERERALFFTPLTLFPTDSLGKIVYWRIRENPSLEILVRNENRRSLAEKAGQTRSNWRRFKEKSQSRWAREEESRRTRKLHKAPFRIIQLHLWNADLD